MIKIIDNFLSEEDSQIVTEYCKNASYQWGGSDDDDLPPTGMTYEIKQIEAIHDLFLSKTKDLVGNMSLYRMYINCFAPSENPYFHTDTRSIKGITFLYYPVQNWEINDGGETQFIVDNEIYGVTPISNRMVYFDASIVHRATAFRDRHRFTLAVKYGEL